MPKLSDLRLEIISKEVLMNRYSECWNEWGKEVEDIEWRLASHEGGCGRRHTP
jgi:hypothetical protein